MLVLVHLDNDNCTFDQNQEIGTGVAAPPAPETDVVLPGKVNFGLF